MTKYNLTETQKQAMQWIIREIKAERIQETFKFGYDYGRTIFSNYDYDSCENPESKAIEINGYLEPGIINALSEVQLISYDKLSTTTYEVTVLGKAYQAVESNFNEPDTSFIKYITPLADISNLDPELKTRCLPILGAGSSDPTLWDSAVRTAGVILETRLRQKGAINDPTITGQGLVNKIFSKTGTLANKFTIDSERQGYRDLYAGIIGTYRNPSAHRLIDPTPEEGGVFIMLIDLLLKKLDTL